MPTRAEKIAAIPKSSALKYLLKKGCMAIGINCAITVPIIKVLELRNRGDS
jgi:hypothetical protein